MKYEKAFEFEVDSRWIRLRFTDGTEFALDHAGVEREFSNPYELGALDVLANLDPLTYVRCALEGSLREYLTTPHF